MKKLLGILIAALALFAIACIEKPDKPVCPAGQETVVESVWVEAIPEHYELREWVPAEYACPTDASAYTSHDDHKDCEKKIGNTWHYADKVKVADGYYTDWKDGKKPHHCDSDTCRKINGVDGHWTEPVCKVPDPQPVNCEVSEWSAPVCIGGIFTLTRTIITPASNGGKACPALVEYGDACGAPDPIPGCMDPLATNYNKLATVDDKTCEYPPEPTPEPKKECKLVQQPYGMAQLFGPDGQVGFMYIYPDPKTGELPGAVGVQRQLCVLGYEAVREGYFGFVYRNSCTGEYIWNGLNVTPRPDILKHGVCARNGACPAE